MKCVNRQISMLLDWSSPEKCLYFVVKCRFLVKKCTFLVHWLGWSSVHRIVHLTKNDHHYGPSACGQVHKLWSSAFDTRLVKYTFFFHQQLVKHAWVQVVNKWHTDPVKKRMLTQTEVVTGQARKMTDGPNSGAKSVPTLYLYQNFCPHMDPLL